MRLLQGLRLAGAAALALLCAAAAQAVLPPQAWRQAAFFMHDPLAAAQAGQQAAQLAEAGETAEAWRPQNGGRPTAAPTARPTAAPTPAATAAPAQTPQPTPASTAPLSLKNGGTVTPRQLAQGSGEGYITLGAGTIKNATSLPDSTLAAATQGALPFEIELDSSAPQVLILHTHATESYQQWDELVYDPAYSARTRDTAQNICAVGARMTATLNAAGVNTLHDETLHDYPSYTESYARSAETARAYLEKYPTIKVILDVHRDAIEADGARIKPVCSIDEEQTAQVMIIAGCDNGGTVKLPNWELNLRFAAAWERQMEGDYPGFTRPVLCGYRFYNQDLTTGSLLIEIGGHGNTLPEALRAGEYAAAALARLFGAGEGSLG